MGYNSYDSRYAAAPGQGYSTVYYDHMTNQFVQVNPNYVSWDRSQPQYVPLNNSVVGKNKGQTTTYIPPTVDFNKLPSQIPAGVQVYGAGTAAQPYQRPTRPTAPAGTGYRPQFDPTFIQQMLAQRFGNNQGTGIPTATRPAGPPTLTPGAVQNYGGVQGQGGLGALRAIANPAPVAPTGGQGETI